MGLHQLWSSFARERGQMLLVGFSLFVQLQSFTSTNRPILDFRCLSREHLTSDFIPRADNDKILSLKSENYVYSLKAINDTQKILIHLVKFTSELIVR
jgi:hypothetical protein